MSKVAVLTATLLMAVGITGIGMPQTAIADNHGIRVTVTGESWDSDSRGFAYFLALTEEEREATSARRGSRISLVGRPEIFAIAGPGPGFKLSFTTAEPTIRLIVDGDRFPRFITQPFPVPKGGGEINVGNLVAQRAEGPEHTWPLPMAAKKLGYGSTLEMMADNKATFRVMVWSSGADGVPLLANDTKISIKKAKAEVIPFTMDKKDTFFQLTGPRLGAFLVIVSFAEGEPADKELIITTTDTVKEPTWEPPRPWTYDPVTVTVRNGFATEVSVQIKID